MPDISLIITTYNRVDALIFVLQALNQQTDMGFEVIIADDGSTKETKSKLELIKLQLSYPLIHIWQEDKGFQAAKSRNKAIAASNTEYLVFLDGDCIPLINFVAQHKKLAQAGCFIAANRILMSESFTQKVLNTILINNKKNELKYFYQWSFYQWLIAYFKGDINRLSPLIYLPRFLFKKNKNKWQGAKTCNLAVWKKDFIDINGFDEQYQGWGHEDADLVVRLLRKHVLRKEGRFAIPVLHLWHPENDRTNEQKNQKRLYDILSNKSIIASSGVKNYL